MTNFKKQIGNEGELRFASEFFRNGWSVFLPYDKSNVIDLVIQKDNQFKRIQIKSTIPKNGIILGRLKSSNNWQVKKYTKKDIDFFGIYDSKKKEGYLIPIEDVEGRTEITLRQIPTKNNQHKKIRNPNKYKYF